jgi:hypothetical protein
MPVLYSPTKVDLFSPAQRGNFFAGIPSGNDAAVCAEICRLAYCRAKGSFLFDRDQINNLLNARGCTVQFFESKGAHCLLVEDAKRKLAVVAFRGTDSDDPTDIFDDCEVMQIEWAPGGKVHMGFARALGRIQEELLRAIDALDCTTFYTGHSLGAAMATLLASIRKPKQLVTIGCPRVGNEDFLATLAGVKSSRYVDCCDMIPRVPPELGGLYRHLGAPLYIAENRTLHLDPDDAFIVRDQVRAARNYIEKYSWINGNVAVRDLADHAPINYIAALAAA